MQGYYIKVTGKVQGVYFRASTVDFVTKNDLKIFGEIWNTSNGEVHILCKCMKEDFDELIKYCSTGPKLARVESISFEEVQETIESNTFSIRRREP